MGMLLFVDAPKFVRVFRLDEVQQKRGRIGRIMKAGYELREDEGAALSDEERRDIGNVTETLKENDNARNRAAALSFPETARLALEYYVGPATEVEKRLIVAAAQEIIRAIRKTQRKDEEDFESPPSDS
jgi:hypothetical protein